MPQSREELFYLYKWLFQETLITLSTQLRNHELSKTLNFDVLSKNPLLLQWIKNKYNLFDDKSDPDKVIE
jgi:hypothetical protein